MHWPCRAIGPIQEAEASRQVHNADVVSELLIVEGDSAATSVSAVRDESCQAVLAIQGKPLNALRANISAIRSNPILLRIIETLLGVRVGADWTDSELIAEMARSEGGVYDRVTLLMDPDADGIHCGVLLMGFLRRFFATLVDEHRLFIVRAPMFVLRLPSGEVIPATVPEHASAVEQQLRDAGINDFQKQRFRGLASLPTGLLRECCVIPETRLEAVVTRADIEAALAIFGEKMIAEGKSH